MIERKANASIVRKQTEIKDLEAKLSEKDEQMRELQERLSKLQQNGETPKMQTPGGQNARRGSKLNP